MMNLFTDRLLLLHRADNAAEAVKIAAFLDLEYDLGCILWPDVMDDEMRALRPQAIACANAVVVLYGGPEDDEWVLPALRVRGVDQLPLIVFSSTPDIPDWYDGMRNAGMNVGIAINRGLTMRTRLDRLNEAVTHCLERGLWESMDEHLSGDEPESVWNSFRWREQEGAVVIVRGPDADKVEVPARINDLPVVEIGVEAFRNCAVLNEVTLPETVRRIGDYAFAGCTELRRVTLNEGLESIGRQAFEDCSSLGEIELPGSVRTLLPGAFRNCTLLENAELPEGLTEIPDECFRGCALLVDPVLPDGLRRIGYRAFAECMMLHMPDLPDGLEQLGVDCYLSSGVARITIPASVKRLGNGAFNGCEMMGSVQIEGGLTEIPEGCFENCMTLTAAELPEGIHSVGENAFRGCTSLEHVSLPESLSLIGDRAFMECISLQLIVLPQGLRVIGAAAFYECCRLQTLLLPPEIDSVAPDAFDCLFQSLDVLVVQGSRTSQVLRNAGIGPSADVGKPAVTVIAPEHVQVPDRSDYSLEGWSFARTGDALTLLHAPEQRQAVFPTLKGGLKVTAVGAHAFAGHKQMETVVLPPEVTALGDNAFVDCSQLYSVGLNEGLRQIGRGCFVACTSLLALRLPASLRRIGDMAFAGCLQLEEIVIPEGVEEIPSSCFSFCSNLRYVTLPKSLRAIRRNAFECCVSLTRIVIPDGVTSIHVDAFSECPDGLEIIINDGTPAAEALLNPEDMFE